MLTSLKCANSVIFGSCSTALITTVFIGVLLTEEYEKDEGIKCYFLNKMPTLIKSIFVVLVMNYLIVEYVVNTAANQQFVSNQAVLVISSFLDIVWNWIFFWLLSKFEWHLEWFVTIGKDHTEWCLLVAREEFPAVLWLTCNAAT